MVKADRLSNMPDDVIHKILSSDDMKAVVGTSSLSSRWRSLWTSMPYLNFSSRAFSSKGKFYESVRAVLRKRDNQTRVSSLNLCIDGSSWDKFVNEVLSYAFCHSVEEMTIQCDKKFRLYNFRSKSLRILTLDGVGFNYSVICKSKWELPVLTTLHLIGVTLYDGDDDDDFDNTQNSEVVSEAWNEFFSKCPNLKYLSLDGCRIGGAGFRVGHPHLSNLKLANGVWGLTTFTVDTPQLKNLCIINCGSVDLSSAPELTSLIYRHLEEFEFEAECCLPSLEKVDLCIRNPHPDSMKDIVDVLQKFQSVKFLTINAEIPELLSSELELISDKPSPFAKLKSLNIYPAIIDDDDEYDYSKDEEYDEYEYEFIYELQYEEEEEEEEEEDEDKEEDEGEEEEEEEEEEEDEDEGVDEDEDDICAEVKNYFLNGSPSATVTKVTCEEMRAVTTPELVINLMEELQVLLKEEKAKIFMARKKRGKTPMQSHVTELHQQGKTEFMKRTQFLTEERVLTTERRWKDPSVQYYIENRMIRHIVSKLQAIKGVLATFPHTKRGEMKACFGRLFAEANLVMKKVNDAISRNIVEEHVKEQFPQNHEEFDTTSGKWGKVYERQSKRLKVEE